MRAVAPWRPGAVARPALSELPRPAPGPGEVLIEVAATALNRADLLQVRGDYPAPPGESAVPGLEAAGVVRSLGAGVEGWRPGDRVMALLAGGGQAEWVAAPVGQLLPVPVGLTLTEAAAVPEAALTAWTNLVLEGAATAGETLLLTGGTSGVGTFTIQLARELGLRVLATGRRVDRLTPLLDLGAEAVLPLDAALAEGVRALTGGRGADLALDLVGGPWLAKVLDALAAGGRCVLIGLVAGRRAELDLGRLLAGRLRLAGSVLRTRPRAEKSDLVRGFAEVGLPRLADGRLRPVIARTYPFEQIADAYADLETGGHLGKLVVTVADSLV